jgi:hypothetical protein
MSRLGVARALRARPRAGASGWPYAATLSPPRGGDVHSPLPLVTVESLPARHASFSTGQKERSLPLDTMVACHGDTDGGRPEFVHQAGSFGNVAVSTRTSLHHRLLELFRNDPTAIVLVLANVAPLINVVVNGEPAGSLLIIYWLQMWIIGFWNCIKLIVIARWAALIYIPMFAIIYVGLVNIFGVIAGGMLDNQTVGTAWAQDFSLWNYWLETLLFFASHALSFYFNFLGRREDETTPAEAQALQPFVRAFPMWVAATIGAFIGAFFNSTAIVVLFVLPMKIILDLVGHFAEHDKRKLRTPSP